MPTILDSIAEEPRPYTLAVTSHRGGTGRSTLCAGLAWHWSQHGNQVALVDANPISTIRHFLGAEQLRPSWQRVQFIHAPHGLQTPPENANIILIDCPPITEPLCQQSLSLADGVILTTGSDPYSLASLGQAATRFKDWLRMQPTVELLGLVIPMVTSTLPQQNRGLGRLANFEPLFIGPPIPVRKEFREWTLTPGSAPPSGLANDALDVLSWAILRLVQERTAVPAA